MLDAPRQALLLVQMGMFMPSIVIVLMVVMMMLFHGEPRKQQQMKWALDG